MEGITMEELAVNLYSLLKCLSAVDEDNPQALEAMPRSIKVAEGLAEQLYEMVLNGQEVK